VWPSEPLLPSKTSETMRKLQQIEIKIDRERERER
jgi:hypothetical protein